jgi:ferrochelatase
MKGVLLLAHGTPDSLDEMPEYLARVRGGRPPSPELVEEMRRNYAAIGGRSPLTDLTRAQAEALQRELGPLARVFFAMRNWRPFIADVLGEMARAGIREAAAIPMAPQYGALSVGKYRDAARAATPEGLRLRFVESWHDDPGLVEAFAERLAAALRAAPPDLVLFTAHSIPERVDEGGDPYSEQVGRTTELVAAAAGLGPPRERWEFAWQSAGRTPEPWLRPSVEDALREAADRGVRTVLVQPIGFVCDHTEVLYDIDVQARQAAAALGMTLARTESLNASPVFIRALARLARGALG